jgi:phosphoribosyl-AMP cyclohydrolase
MPNDIAIAEELIARLSFDERGLIPAIAQAASSKDVLMLAWMNADAIRETLLTGQVTYWSRSRGALWRKGESSGHTQKLVDLRFDCDADALLLTVEQSGPACHTNRPNCFFNKLEPTGIRIISDPVP